MNQHLSEEYAYLVKETIRFIEIYFENIVPAGKLDQGIYLWTKEICKKADRLMAAGKKEEMEILVENYLKYAQEYFKSNSPWQTYKSDRRACCNAVLNTVQLIANLAVLMDALECSPAERVIELFRLERVWRVQYVHSGYEIPKDLLIN